MILVLLPTSADKDYSEKVRASESEAGANGITNYKNKKQHIGRD